MGAGPVVFGFVDGSCLVGVLCGFAIQQISRFFAALHNRVDSVLLASHSLAFCFLGELLSMLFFSFLVMRLSDRSDKCVYMPLL